MPKEHPNPTPATAKYLYAHAFRCAYKGCRRPLYRVDEQTGNRTLNSRICHINARSEDGPRWDAHQTEAHNRDEKNLLLMCVEHASAIDDRKSSSNYPAELLRQWKAEQFEAYERLKQGWMIDDDMAKEAIHASQHNAQIIIKNSTVHLGGQGGDAPGAGGGGGGAIGESARGGRGGDGGKRRTEDGKYILPLLVKAAIPRLPELAKNFKPGSGGGGAGAVGDKPVGGDGGGGGEQVSFSIDVAELRKDGFDHAEITIGEGGQAAKLPGQHGISGGDSVINFVTKDGKILKSVRAQGGGGGTSGLASLLDGTNEITQQDIDGGFRITTLMPANAAELRDGLVFVLGGGWKQCLLPRIPCEAVWYVICVAVWRTLEGATPRGIYLSLVNPDDHEVACVAISIENVTQNGSYLRIQPIGALFDAEGIWKLGVHSGGFLLAELEIDVRVAGPLHSAKGPPA